MKKLFFPLLLALGFLISNCGTDPYAPACVNEYSAAQDTADRRAIRQFIAEKQMTGVKTTKSGLSYIIFDPGEGQKPRATSTIKADYKGYLISDKSGKAFDSAGYKPPFKLDAVIKGWTEGLQLIGEGGVIRLMVPSHLAYGSCGNGNIGPDEPLSFEIRLIQIDKY